MTLSLPKWPPDWPEITESVRSLLTSGDWGRYHSQSCRDLESRIREQFQAESVRLCSSGNAAIEIALRAAQVGPGDEVVLAGYDYPGNFRTIELLGARPVLVDIDPETLSMNPEQLDDAAGPSVRALIATHLYGQPADVATIAETCKQNGWVCIEDACQVIGMSISKQLVGSFGDFATLSFGGSKIVSAGGGGAILANSPRLAARLGPLMDRPGEVYPLSPLQAAVIAPQLDRVDEWNRLRASTVDWLAQHQDRLSDWHLIHGQNRANEPVDVSPAHYKIGWLAKDRSTRDRIIHAAKERQLPIGEGFRSSSRCSERRCRKPVSTPHSERVSDCLFLLDHRALMIEENQRGPLLKELEAIHDAAK
ncbi:MAG: aminotransferase class V-fold PLP-dependent enzyme [Planctomycetota bacterium]